MIPFGSFSDLHSKDVWMKKQIPIFILSLCLTHYEKKDRGSTIPISTAKSSICWYDLTISVDHHDVNDVICNYLCGIWTYLCGINTYLCGRK